jgi:hypothetical protein
MLRGEREREGFNSEEGQSCRPCCADARQSRHWLVLRLAKPARLRITRMTVSELEVERLHMYEEMNTVSAKRNRGVE